MLSPFLLSALSFLVVFPNHLLALIPYINNYTISTSTCTSNTLHILYMCMYMYIIVYKITGTDIYGPGIIIKIIGREGRERERVTYSCIGEYNPDSQNKNSWIFLHNVARRPRRPRREDQD